MSRVFTNQRKKQQRQTNKLRSRHIQAREQQKQEGNHSQTEYKKNAVVQIVHVQKGEINRVHASMHTWMARREQYNTPKTQLIVSRVPEANSDGEFEVQSSHRREGQKLCSSVGNRI